MSALTGCVPTSRQADGRLPAQIKAFRVQVKAGRVRGAQGRIFRVAFHSCGATRFRLTSSLDTRSYLLEAMAKARTRSSWNDRLTHWERPPSNNEEAQIERTANAAMALVSASAMLTAERVMVRPQGSYFNNTNVRLEADMDLRLQLPDIFIDYAGDVDQAAADNSEGYRDTGRTFSEIATLVRNELASACRAKFGANRVSIGGKAVSVEGLSGSHADVDLVPAFRLHWIVNNGYGGYHITEGVAIVGANGAITQNFPEQHHVNGKTKRPNTAHRFKKVVRMAKRLNCELADDRAIPHRMPSFLIECLIYAVEDAFFLQLEDDRYDRLLRVLYRLSALLWDAEWHKTATEVNDIKYLFHTCQFWTLHEARAFVAAAITQLEA
ncbi:hypothetical protein [Sphingomonas sp. RB1R13]|uniref:hypothetical protein n=1 Tax=Sphingomonas sp. RB1R13 TaxID=3096159 RepID=UPI002FC64658